MSVRAESGMLFHRLEAERLHGHQGALSTNDWASKLGIDPATYRSLRSSGVSVRPDTIDRIVQARFPKVAQEVAAYTKQRVDYSTWLRTGLPLEAYYPIYCLVNGISSAYPFPDVAELVQVRESQLYAKLEDNWTDYVQKYQSYTQPAIYIAAIDNLHDQILLELKSNFRGVLHPESLVHRPSFIVDPIRNYLLLLRDVEIKYCINRHIPTLNDRLTDAIISEHETRKSIYGQYQMAIKQPWSSQQIEPLKRRIEEIFKRRNTIVNQGIINFSKNDEPSKWVRDVIESSLKKEILAEDYSAWLELGSNEKSEPLICASLAEPLLTKSLLIASGLNDFQIIPNYSSRHILRFIMQFVDANKDAGEVSVTKSRRKNSEIKMADRSANMPVGKSFEFKLDDIRNIAMSELGNFDRIKSNKSTMQDLNSAISKGLNQLLDQLAPHEGAPLTLCRDRKKYVINIINKSTV